MKKNGLISIPIDQKNLPKRSQLREAMLIAFALIPLSVTPLLAEPIDQEEGEIQKAKSTAEQTQSPLFSLGTVTVKANNPEESTLFESADLFESFIGRDTIELFEANDVGKALAYTPGVFYDAPIGMGGRRASNRYEPTVRVRGFDLRYVPVFVDGIPVYIPYDGDSDMSRFSTADISSIEVAKGYSSVMYGHNTLGGAINIVTMKPRSEFDFMGTAGAGQDGTHELSANVGTLQERWYAQVSASERGRRYTTLSENYVGKDALGKKVDSDRYLYRTKDRRFGLKLGWTPTDTDEYVLSYSRQTAKKYPGSEGDNGFVPTKWIWPQWDRETISFVSNTWVFDEKLYIKPRIYYDTFKNTLLNFRPNESSKYDDKAFGASVEVGTTAIDRHLIKMMVSYKRETHKSIDEDLLTHKSRSSRATQKFYSIALEDNIALTDRLEAQIGVIYTKRKADAEGIGKNTESLISQYPAASSMLAPSIHSTDYQAALFYKLTEDDTFRFAIGKKTRFPSFKESYSNYGDNEKKCPKGETACTPGEFYPSIALQNPGLKPESATNIEIGYSGMPVDGLSVDTALFYSQSKNKIQRSNDNWKIFPGYAVTQNENLPGKVVRKGFELGINYYLNEMIKIGGGYTYLNVKNRDHKEIKIINTPKNFGFAYITIQPYEWLELTPSINARSSSYADSDGINRNRGYAIYNFKASVKPPQWKGVTLNAGIENIFNKNYASYDSIYPSAGRYLYFNMRYEIY